jgi:hypothetical protein
MLEWLRDFFADSPSSAETPAAASFTLEAHFDGDKESTPANFTFVANLDGKTLQTDAVFKFEANLDGHSANASFALQTELGAVVPIEANATVAESTEPNPIDVGTLQLTHVDSAVIYQCGNSEFLLT